MRTAWKSVGLGAVAALLGIAAAASYDDIAPIEVYGQHFFYTSNGTQFLMKGVAYQQNYQPNGTASANVTYTDPLADADGCRRDIPVMQQIYTNVIRVYALDPTQNHDDCMAQLASAGIYVVADLGQPSTSIQSDDPSWNVPLYQRYTSVVDSMAKYKNVIGFFAGNENVSKANQTAAAAFVKAAVRDVKGYIKSQNYRSTLSVGYATADVDSRDDLAAYFACEPDNSGNSTQIDFWGYNVYSWCGESSYAESKYGERVQFFSDYPVPVFFAEYGCNQNIQSLGGPMHRPFTEVGSLFGNMTNVFSGGIVYEWFNDVNEYGLVSISDDKKTASPYPDFTSLQSQLAAATPSLISKANYSPSNTAPACPTTASTWQAVASPLPPSVNPQLCSCMAADLQCNIKSTDATKYGDVFAYICGSNANYCQGIAHNATSGQFGALGGCSAKDTLGWVANQYYLGNKKQSSACNFNGIATLQSASTASGCSSLLSVLGTAATGSVPSPTGKQGNTAGGSGGGSGSGASSSKAGAAQLSAGGFVGYGWILGMGWVLLSGVAGMGMIFL